MARGTALGIPRAHLERACDELVAFAGLEDAIDRPLRTYSSGMRARLQFAMATCAAPEILPVDEALSVGDAAFKKQADTRMRELMGAPAPCSWCHTRWDRSLRSARAIWIHEGRLVDDGPAEQVAESYKRWANAR